MRRNTPTKSGRMTWMYCRLLLRDRSRHFSMSSGIKLLGDVNKCYGILKCHGELTYYVLLLNQMPAVTQDTLAAPLNLEANFQQASSLPPSVQLTQRSEVLVYS